MYLDDGINIGSTFAECEKSTRSIVKDLESAGFVLNREKRHLVPKQIGEWLGTIINTVTMSFSVPQKKIVELKNLLKTACNDRRVTARYLSKITGLLSSMHLSLGPIVRLMTRCICTDIQKYPEWDFFFYPSPECLGEIKFWLRNIDNENGYAIKPNPLTSQILFTDASKDAYGGYILKRLGETICHGTFDHQQKQKSSTERELLAIKYCLLSLTREISHEVVNIRTDNYAASRIIEIGSPKHNLQNLAIEIFEICLKHDIKLLPTWIPREENQLADFYSKIVDTDDWSIDNQTFRRICAEFGEPTVDRFADDKNKK